MAIMKLKLNFGISFQMLHGKLGLLCCLSSHPPSVEYRKDKVEQETVMNHNKNQMNVQRVNKWKMLSLLMDRFLFVVYIVIDIILLIVFVVVRP